MNPIFIDPNHCALTESQIAALVVDENGGPVHLNIDLLRKFKLTDGLACKILCALCELEKSSSTNSNNAGSNSAANGQQQQQQQVNNGPTGNSTSQFELIKSSGGVRSINNQDINFTLVGRQDQAASCIEEINLFAEYCRQNSIQLQQLLQTFDDEDYTSVRIFRGTNYASQLQRHSSIPPLTTFRRFWQFCTNLASTDKNGLSIVGRVFFTQVWQHNQGFQLSFIVNCIEQNLISTIFLQGQQQQASVSHQQQQQQQPFGLNQIIPYSELLKCQPDFDALPELNNWKFQRLYQILIEITVPGNICNLQMSSNCFARVLEIFEWPLQYCPDLTVLGLLGVSGQTSAAKVEILSSAIPTFLNASHPNAAIILHTIWSNDSHPSSDQAGTLAQQKSNAPLTWSQKTLLQALSDHYTRSSPEEQQQRLSRILDVAQDIKTLFRLLDGTCYPFVIDLACLASRREYLKLDKWLMDKLTENGENFIRALNSFLTKRYLPLLNRSNKDSNIGPVPVNGPNLPAETLAVMLTFLQQCVMPNNGPLGTPMTELSQAVKNEVYELIGNSSIMLQRAPRHPPPGVATSMANEHNRVDRGLMGFVGAMDKPSISEVDKLQAEFEAKRLAQRNQRVSTGQNAPLPPPVTRPSIANNANIDNLLAAGSSENQPAPPEVLQDKVFFIVNNLSLINLKQKAEEFKELFGDDDTYYGWCAQYFSTKRAALEQNFQPLYANFLYELKNPKLIEAMTRETYKNIKHLLRLDKKADNINERTVLKNLGQWLGLLTLARNKPILHVDLDLKGLLVEAYHKGTQELLYVVPFLAEILKTTQKSKIFKPTNPFVLGLLRALVELRQVPNLKLNLEFQVEVLFNNLGVDLNKLVGQSSILNDEKYYSKIEFQLGSKQISSQASSSQPVMQQTIKNQLQQQNISQPVPAQVNNINIIRPNDFAASLSPLNTPPLLSLGNTSAMGGQIVPGLQQNIVSPVSWSSKFNYNDLDVTNTATLNNLITIQPSIGIFTMQPNLKSTVRPAIELAISEWLPSILEKTLKICLPTIEQIIKKDFALVPDETHMQRAAHSLVRHLVSYMAMMLCRDPEQVEQSLTSNLKVAFTRACPTIKKELAEHAASVITADNLELARAFIIKTAIERALADIDKLLQNEFELRRAARLEGHQYVDPEHLAFHTKLVNDGMRLKPAPVLPEQMRSYDEIGHNIAGFKRFETTINDSSLGSSPFNELGPGSMSLPPIVAPNTTSISKSSPMGATTFNANLINQLMSNRVMAQNQLGNQLPNFINLNEGSKVTTPQSGFTENESSIAFFDSLVNDLMPQLRQLAQSLPSNLTTEIAQVVHCMQLLRSNPTERNYKILIVKILESMYELVFENGATLDINIICRCKELHILLLRALSETFGANITTRHITRQAWTRFLTSIQEEKKSPGLEIFLELLMQNQLTNDAFLDEQLVLVTESSMNPALIIRFIHRFKAHFNESSLPRTVNLLARLKSMASQPLALEFQNCIDALQSPARPQSNYTIQPAISSANTFNNTSPQIQQPTNPANLLQRETPEGDPPGLVEKTERLLREWVSIHQSGHVNKMFPVFVHQMTVHGILKTDDLVTRFFRLSTEMCVESCYRLLATQPNGPNSLELRNKCYETLDAFTMLIVLLIKNSGSSSAANMTPEQPTAKINLLSKILSIIANVAIKDQENRQADFQHLAYYRILILLFIELNLSPPMLGLPTQGFNNFNQITATDVIAENIQFQVLNEFTKTLRTLRPSRVPSFAFAWLDFLSHRLFVEKCLGGSNTANRTTSTLYKGWALYAQLLIDLIRFEAPFLRNVELPPSVDLLYKGTLKMFLVLLHDFPEFLCEYCYSLCDVIPCNAIQLRNLVLSAFPRKMRLPDPFTPNLKIDQLPEMSQPPKTVALQTNLINSITWKEELDNFLRSRAPVSFLNNLSTYLRTPNQYLISLAGGPTSMNSLNVPLLNALVLYVGQSAISALAPKPINMTTIGTTAHMAVFEHLATTLETEGRYLFLNAIANQLRYPNSHTHYFSSALLYLFAIASSEQIQEQITRVLVERLIIMRPHPWGLLVTFIELIKNPLFRFWKHEFVRCAPEIEKLFDSVARSCCVTNMGAQKSK